MRIYRAR
jgi:hypothetical protein